MDLNALPAWPLLKHQRHPQYFQNTSKQLYKNCLGPCFRHKFLMLLNLKRLPQFKFKDYVLK